MWFRWTSKSFAKSWRSIATARTTSRSGRYRAGRSWINLDPTQRRRHCYGRMLFGEHMTWWWWGRKRPWRRQRMLFDLQSAYDYSLAIIIPFCVYFLFLHLCGLLFTIVGRISGSYRYKLVFCMCLCLCVYLIIKVKATAAEKKCVFICTWMKWRQQNESFVILHFAETKHTDCLQCV